MFNVYSDHRGAHVLMPSMASVEEVKGLAESAARLGNNAFYRAFRVEDQGERFETAFSVLNGIVREHRDVTIPTAHW